jgi:hypothetical protein
MWKLDYFIENHLVKNMIQNNFVKIQKKNENNFVKITNGIFPLLG